MSSPNNPPWVHQNARLRAAVLCAVLVPHTLMAHPTTPEALTQVFVHAQQKAHIQGVPLGSLQGEQKGFDAVLDATTPQNAEAAMTLFKGWLSGTLSLNRTATPTKTLSSTGAAPTVQGVLASQVASASQGVLTTQGTLVSQGALATQGAAASQGALATQGVSASQGVSATQGVLATQGAAASQGVSATQGVLATQGMIAAQGLTASQVAPHPHTAPVSLQSTLPRNTVSANPVSLSTLEVQMRLQQHTEARRAMAHVALATAYLVKEGEPKEAAMQRPRESLKALGMRLEKGGAHIDVPMEVVGEKKTTTTVTETKHRQEHRTPFFTLHPPLKPPPPGVS
jgi:hypothetical protein